MPSQIVEPRDPTDHERELIRWMLVHSSPDVEVFLGQLAHGRVASGCNCGCASINLKVEGCSDPTGGVTILADFLYGPDACLCGVFVFEQNGILAGLEVYGLTTDAPVVLPDAADLRPI